MFDGFFISDTKFSHLCNLVHRLTHPFHKRSLSETAESCLKIQHILNAQTNINNIIKYAQLLDSQFIDCIMKAETQRDSLIFCHCRCNVTAKRAVLMLLTLLSMNKVTMPEGYDIEKCLTDRVEYRVDSYIRIHTLQAILTGDV